MANSILVFLLTCRGAGSCELCIEKRGEDLAAAASSNSLSSLPIAFGYELRRSSLFDFASLAIPSPLFSMQSSRVAAPQLPPRSSSRFPKSHARQGGVRSTASPALRAWLCRDLALRSDAIGCSRRSFPLPSVGGPSRVPSQN